MINKIERKKNIFFQFKFLRLISIKKWTIIVCCIWNFFFIKKTYQEKEKKSQEKLKAKNKSRKRIKKLSRRTKRRLWKMAHIKPENWFEPFRQAVTLKLKKNTEMNDHKHLTHCECGVHIHTTDPNSSNYMYICTQEKIYTIILLLFQFGFVDRSAWKMNRK